jgi:hypothetical protein
MKKYNKTLKFIHLHSLWSSFPLISLEVDVSYLYIILTQCNVRWKYYQYVQGAPSTALMHCGYMVINFPFCCGILAFIMQESGVDIREKIGLTYWLILGWMMEAGMTSHFREIYSHPSPGNLQFTTLFEELQLVGRNEGKCNFYFR